MSHLLIEEALNVLLAPNIGLIVRLEPRFMWDINDHFLALSCPLDPTEVINSAAIETTEPISPIWRMNVYSPALGSAQQVSRSGLAISGNVGGGGDIPFEVLLQARSFEFEPAAVNVLPEDKTSMHRWNFEVRANRTLFFPPSQS